MTFYNVISAILFLAAFQQFLASIGTPHLWPAATLAVVVFNDALNTSDTLERGPTAPQYTIWMKLIDLVCFFVLSLALIGLNPSRNAFNVDVSGTLPWVGTPAAFWLLLVVYWGLLTLWNVLAGEFDALHWPKWLKVISVGVAVPFLVAAIASLGSASFSLVYPAYAIIAFAVVLVYLVLLKPIFRR